jgi:hypothetical protein
MKVKLAEILGQGTSNQNWIWIFSNLLSGLLAICAVNIKEPLWGISARAGEWTV